MKRMFTLIWSAFSLIAAIFGLKWATPYDPSTYESMIDMPSYVTVGEMRVELLSDTLVRIEQKGPRGFENRPSFTVQKRTGWEKIEFTQKTESGKVYIQTKEYTVCLPENASSPEGAFVTDKNGNVLWQFETETDASMYLPSPSDELSCWYFSDNPRVIPSEDKYTVSRLWHNLNGWDLTNKASDIFVFMPQGSYERFTSDFVDLTGRSELITLNLLGYWDSRYYQYTAESAMKQIEDYESRGYPLDVLVIDTDWRTSVGGTGYTVNTKLFPNMKKFLSQVHDKGISVVFNDHPEPTAGTKNLLDKTEVTYRNTNLKRILNKGLDYWWYDRNWWTSLKPVDEDLSIYTSGMYAYQSITEDFYSSKAKRGEDARRALLMANVDGINNGTLSNPSELAAHRYTLQWTGDIGTSSESLEQEIFNMIYGGSEMGLPYLSSDLGGHTSEVTRDMYIRWIQYGALSPICRVHCTKPYSRMPWLYGKTAEQVTHEYVNLRYRLLPLYYSLAHENYETGLPLIRRLDVKYPQYAEADRNDEYLLSDSILVAPLSQGVPKTDDYTFTSDGKEGLKAEYFSNDKLEGEPEIVKYDKKIDFDWGLGAPSGLSVSDYFSVRWSGRLTVGEKPIFFTAYSDDGIRIKIDGKTVVDGWNTYNKTFKTDFLEAGSTHDIVVEYFDGNEHAHVYVTAYSEGRVTRDVFLPDGRWIDVWTGESYVGPATVTVSHSLETSPIFVRSGSVLTLADNMKNTNEKDWSHLTLEVFPSEDNDGSATLYEDDVTTVAYKNGEYRTTDITLSGDRVQTLKIAPAKGSFDGPRAFESRSYTVRVHQRDDWGTLKSVKLGGKEVAFKTLEKDKSADVLSIVGAARDADVYEIEFTAKTDEESVLVLEFSSSAPDGRNESYDDSRAELSLFVNRLQKEEASFTIGEGARDFILYGLNWEFETAKKNGSLVSDITCRGKEDLFDDNYTISWKDSDGKERSTTCGVVSYHDLKTTLNSDSAGRFKLYLGGYKSIGKLTVRDRSGNVKTATFGDMETNYYREVIIDADGESELEVTYSLLCGTNITAAACVAE